VVEKTAVSMEKAGAALGKTVIQGQQTQEGDDDGMY
jgi:hypothetical protein